MDKVHSVAHFSSHRLPLWRIMDLSREERTFWSTGHRIILAIMALLFVTFVSLKIHGYSIGVWQSQLGQPVEGLIDGIPQDIRSDDWAVVLPLGIMETTPAVKFDCNVSLIGHGMSAILLSRSLCLSGVGAYASLFKPWTWGYLMGADTGLAWMWWTLFLGLTYTVFLCVYSFSHRKLLFSLFAALGFVYAPYQQYWALNQAEIYAMGFGIMIFFWAFLNARSTKRILVFAAGIFYCGMGFTLPLYPPTQVMVGYFVVGSCLVHFFLERERVTKTHILGIVGVGILYASSLAVIGHETLQTINLMANTVYPGKRFSTGGGWPWERIFMNLLAPTQSIKSWGGFGNLCEIAGFLLIAPLFLFAVPKFIGRTKDLKAALFYLSWIALLGLGIYMFVGIPAGLAKISFLSFVPTMRVVSGLGLWDFCLWVSGALMLFEFRSKSKTSYWDLLYFIPWLLVLYFTKHYLTSTLSFPHQKLDILYAFAVALIAVVWWRPLVLSFVFCVWSISLTHYFNPTFKGGVDTLKADPLSKIIEEVAVQYPTESWVVGDQFIYGNLIRLLGHRSLAGTYYYPQFDLWEKFDPNHTQVDVYNRYAHVEFTFGGAMDPVLTLIQADEFGITVDPKYQAFEDEGVRLFLVRNDQAFKNQDFRLLASTGDWKIYRRNLIVN